MYRVFIGIGDALIFGLIAYATLLLGSYVSEISSSALLGFIVGLPGTVFMLPTVPFIFLIDFLPMDKVFPQGGASGIFGSLYIFGIVIWSILFGFLAHFKVWPFKRLK